MAEISERQCLVPQNLKIYKRRWYILFIFGFTLTLFLVAEKGYSTIADTSEVIYNWKNWNIALMTIFVKLFGLVTMYPCAVLLRKKGLRSAMISTTAITLLGAVCRCLPLNDKWYTYFAYLSSILLGAASPLLKLASTTLSSSWFPVHERTFATSIMMMSASLGEGTAFLLCPALVPNHPCRNQTFSTNLVNKRINCTEEEIQNGKIDIKNLFYIEAVPFAVLLIIMCFYFPSHPPSPPSVTARIQEGEELVNNTGSFEDFKICAKKLHLWILVTMLVFTISISFSWYNVLTIMLNNLGISQKEAGYIGLFAAIGALVINPSIGKIANIFPRHVKTILVIVKLVLTVFTITSVAMSLKFLPLIKPLLYVSVIGIISMISAAWPIMLEIGCEVGFPAPPVVSTGILATLLTLFDFLFLSIFLIPNMTVNWMNWMLGGCMILSLPLFFVFKPGYKRLNLDQCNVDNQHTINA